MHSSAIFFYPMGQVLLVPISTEEKYELKGFYQHNKANVYTRISEFKWTFMCIYKFNFYTDVFMYNRQIVILQ